MICKYYSTFKSKIYCFCYYFSGTPGLKDVVQEDLTELDCFNLLFDETFWGVIVEETNRYAEQRIQRQTPLPLFSRLRKWTPVTVDELKVFLALTIAMGLVRKPDIADYFTNEFTYETPFFSKTMSRDRFLLILSNIHFVDNNVDHANDRLYKLRPFITMLRNNFLKYEPEENLAFDEGTCPFKGKIVFRVYNPAKPNKFGIKLYQCCESSSGYIVSFDIYDGTPGCAHFSELVGLDQDATQTTKIVIGLLARSGLLGKGHKIFLDNYYTSPELAAELDANDTYLCGTVRVNRKGMPRAFPLIKLKAGDSVYRRKGNMLVIKFHEKRDVHIISTVHEATYTILQNRRYGGDLVKPTAVVDYCKHMGGVDLSDQLLQYYESLRRTVKWYKKLFFHLLNMLVVNAYKLFLKYGHNSVKRSHQKFRSELVRALILSAETAPRPGGSFGRTPSEPLERLQGAHLPVYIPCKVGAKRKHPQRDCVACNSKSKDRVGHKRRQSIFMCDKCKVALCMPDCFRIYHTHKHYKRLLQSNGNSSSSSDDD